MLLNTMLLLSGGDFFSRWLEGWNLGGLILVLIGAALIIVEMLIPGFERPNIRAVLGCNTCCNSQHRSGHNIQSCFRQTEKRQKLPHRA